MLGALGAEVAGVAFTDGGPRTHRLAERIALARGTNPRDRRSSFFRFGLNDR